MSELVDALREWKTVYLHGQMLKYQVSNFGEVMSFQKKKPQLLKPHKMDNGYEIVCLYDNDCNKNWILVHRLVAMHFIPIPQHLLDMGLSYDDLEVNHKCGTYEGKSNNSVGNLEWVTSSENKFHAYRTGLKKDGESHPEAKYSNYAIELACKLLEENEHGIREIAKETGVDTSTLSQILAGNQWKSISANYDFTNRKKQRNLYPKESIDACMKLLSENDINGLSFAEIGRKCDMTRTAVWYLYHTRFCQ